eukprot:TRINITY_DN9026_c1_g1_i1.p1 TRINITY_DN9026_c1_g1~~TRINITY_DN9026_c1_g1_i1.p1  ORF type:complete len:206 (-),score=11.05 TRINITY_DN9026_c1_g1_i1:175-792(-)
MMSAFTMGNGQIAMLVLGLATCAFGADPDLPIYQEGKPGYVHFDLATGGSWFVSNSLCPCLISYTLTAFNPAIDPQINVYVLNQDNFDLYKSGARFQYYQAASSANSNFTQLDAWTSPSDVKYVVINRNPGPGLTEIKGTLKFATNVINAARESHTHTHTRTHTRARTRTRTHEFVPLTETAGDKMKRQMTERTVLDVDVRHRDL